MIQAGTPICMVTGDFFLNHPKRSRKLLLVEDDASIRQALAEFLRLEGYDVATAIDGEDAIGQVLLQLPDLVISDVLMPVCDGLQLARRLCNLTVPFLLMSGFGSEGDMGSLRDHPLFVGFTLKPIQIERLLMEIETYFNPRPALSTGGLSEAMTNDSGVRW